MKYPLLASLLAAILVLGSVPRAAADATALPGSPVRVTTFTGEYSIEKVGTAVVQAAQNRGWTVVSADRSTVVLTLTHRGEAAKLFVAIGARQIQFYSDSWEVKASGEHIKPFVPMGWIRNLEKDVLHLLPIVAP